eukprot:9003926-Alexandrium_andersonii.AAC.1
MRWPGTPTRRRTRQPPWTSLVRTTTVPISPMTKIGWGANAQLDEAAVYASPKDRTVLAEACNPPKD